MKSYADHIQEIQDALDTGKATETQLEVARALSMQPNRTAFKDRGMTGQDQYNRAQAALQSASRAYDQVINDRQERQQRAQKAYGDELPKKEQPGMISRNREANENKPARRYADPAMQTAHELTRNWPGPKTSQPSAQAKKPVNQRPPVAKKNQGDPYLNMAAQLTGHWPGSAGWHNSWGKGK